MIVQDKDFGVGITSPLLISYYRWQLLYIIKGFRLLCAVLGALMTNYKSERPWSISPKYDEQYSGIPFFMSNSQCHCQKSIFQI